MKWMAFIFIGSLFFFSCSYLPEEKVESMNLKEEKGDYNVYFSGITIPENAFLMVPGGLVDPHVYSCWIDRLVDLDTTFSVILLKYPSNLAITNIGKVMKVTESIPRVSRWAIGGHSLGGVVAASAVNKNRDYFDGLVMLASWPTASSDLSDWGKPVISIYASQDQLATKEEVFSYKLFLPQGDTITDTADILAGSVQTYYVEIAGGNHSGFGCYGLQEGDGEALISPQEQQDELIEYLHAYLSSIW